MTDQVQELMFAGNETRPGESTFVLQRLELFNWGPFSGLHRADFDPEGTAIIGPTGSGKTTLVDALMTLLVSQPRYNLASTGGHESDRTLISYVRGVLGGDGSDGREQVARAGKTITGICATYHNGEETLRLAGLLWTDGTSNAAADLKRRWIFSLAEEQTLESWLRSLNENGARELMRTGRETAKLRIFDSKKAYLSHTRKFFDVGENAFTLLNRAAGLKQLNSIDEIFRDLVLDDRTAFDRALEVAGEFDNLAGIHAELEMARRQQESLVPVAEEHRKLLKSREKETRLRALKRIVPIWFAVQGVQRWTSKLKEVESNQQSLRSQRTVCSDDEQTCRSQVDTLREQYLELGGNVISELENTITAQTERVETRRKYAADYRRMVGKFGLSDDLSESALTKNQAALSEQRKQVEGQRDAKHDQTLVALSKQRESEIETEEIASAIQKVKERPGSNIPPRFQDFRSELAEQLTLKDGDLPFLAELVEVKTEESAWRGAIERAIGSERLRVLVPEKQIDEALRWVNQRDNQLHVRLQRASQSREVTFFDDGFARKLNFKKHALQGTAKQLLAGRDLHCVDSASELRDTEHGLTIEGMISGRRGRFEKQDQRRIRDDWMTGFDNKDQLETLTRELSRIRELAQQQSATVTNLKSELKDFDDRLTLIDQILTLDFSTIDLPTAESDLNRSQQRLTALLDPNSDASRAKSEFDSANQKLDSIRKEIGELDKAIAVLQEKHEQAEKSRERAAKRAGAGLSDDETRLVEKQVSVPPETSVEELSDLERHVADAVERKHGQQLDRVAEHERRLVRFMEAALKVDSGALAETNSELEDVPDFLERLRVLNVEALPEKLSRFLEYLNRSSDQGVTQLLSGITEEVDAIEHRIDDLNQTLVKVDFRKGRYLQLLPQRIKHERLRA
jgi:uncharacterized protein YPO0396